MAASIVDAMDRFDDALARIDAANAADPNRESHEGKEWPKELLYGRRMSAWLEKLAPEASDAVKLAARAQHIERWHIPRAKYDAGKKGYHLWRTTLYRYHAERAGAILAAAGYDLATVERVGALLQKKHLRSDEDAQTIEDAACLVFLENYFADFAKKIIDLALTKDSEIRIIDTICHDIRERQAAALELACRADLMLVVGGRSSANTNRLAELCSQVTETHLIETADEIKPAWLEGKRLIGVTAGASTAEASVDEVMERLKSIK